LSDEEKMKETKGFKKVCALVLQQRILKKFTTEQEIPGQARDDSYRASSIANRMYRNKRK
jgi:hypothetical protein